MHEFDYAQALSWSDFQTLAATPSASPWCRRSADEATSLPTVIPVWRTLGDDWLTPVQALSAAEATGSYLLESIAPEARLGRYSFVGLSSAEQVRGLQDRFEWRRGAGSEWQADIGVDPWERLRQQLGSWCPPKLETEVPFWGGAVGYVAYDAVRRFEPSVAPLAALTDGYEFAFAFGGTSVVFDQRQGRLWLLHLQRICATPTGAERVRYLRTTFDAAQAELDAWQARLGKAAKPEPLRLGDVGSAALPGSSFTREAYKQAVVQAQEHIRAGDIFQVVLSQRFVLPRQSASFFDIYRALRQLNPSPYLFQINFEELALAGASPETLVRVHHGEVELKPIAGTRPRGRDAAEDVCLGEELLADPKERAEHVMLVDLGRNDIGRISEVGSVHLEDLMTVERYSHVMHIVSRVLGRLRPDLNALDVLRASLPAGTLSGAPKVRAMQIIDALEGQARGIYGGAVGYLGFDGNADFAIAIRTVAGVGDEVRIQTGAGIVEASDPDAEYEETINKARAALLAVALARDHASFPAQGGRSSQD